MDLFVCSVPVCYDQVQTTDASFPRASNDLKSPKNAGRPKGCSCHRAECVFLPETTESERVASPVFTLHLEETCITQVYDVGKHKTANFLPVT